MINRTQPLILTFLGLAWGHLPAILAVAPEMYDAALLPAVDPVVVRYAFLAAISAFILLLAFGVRRPWLWTLWLILVDFLFGVLRVSASLLQLTGTLPTDVSARYAAYQAPSGLAKFAIDLSVVAESGIRAESRQRSAGTRPRRRAINYHHI